MSIPDGRETIRAFLPARDHDASKQFYERLGFKKLFDGEVAILAAGASEFILQRYYDEGCARTA